jgi:hypothetical protein
MIDVPIGATRGKRHDPMVERAAIVVMELAAGPCSG